MSVTHRHAEKPWCKAKYCWCTIDAHFPNGARSVSLSLLVINAVYTSFMNICIQFPLRLPKMQDQRSLTRCWLSFSGCGRDRVSLVFDFKDGQFIGIGHEHTNVNILGLAIGYVNATINRKTRKQEQEIETDGSCQTRKNQWVNEHWSGFGLPRLSGSGVRQGRNWTEIFQ